MESTCSICRGYYHNDSAAYKQNSKDRMDKTVSPVIRSCFPDNILFVDFHVRSAVTVSFKPFVKIISDAITPFIMDEIDSSRSNFSDMEPLHVLPYF